MNPAKPPAVNRSPPLPSAPPPNPSLLPGIIVGSAIAIGGLTLAGVIVVAALFIRGNDRQDAALPGPLVPPAEAERVQAAVPGQTPAGPTPEEMAREEALKQKQAIEAARRKLAAAGGGRTDAIRAAAEKLEEEIDALRQGTDTEPGLRLRPDGGSDPQDDTQRAIAAANRADEVGRLSDDAPSLVADLEAATTELAAAVGVLDAAKQQVPALAAAERQARKNKMEEDQANDLANRQRDAFAAFAKEASLVAELPARDGTDPSGDGRIKRSSPEVDLGPFPVQDLVEPSLRLAVPEETINGTPFEAEIVSVEDNRWEIRSTQGYPGFDVKPQKFADLVVVNGLLRLEFEPKLLDKRPVAILRRCVILIEARDPETKLLKVREIRLVKPTKVGLLQVAAAGGPQQMQIPVPVGIFSKDTPPGATTAAELALPVSGIEITGQWGGSEKMTKRLPKEAAAADQPGIVTWPGVRVREMGNGVTLELKVAVSLLGATLTATPTLAGPNSAGINLERLVEFLDKRAPKLSDENKDFKSRIEKCPGKDFKKAQGSKTDSDGVKSWFMRPLATFGQMGLALPKHETIQSSMNEYFSAQYRRLAEEKRVAWERDIASQPDERKREEMKKRPVPTPDFPNSFDDWTKRCSTAKEPEWNKEFTDRLMAWSVWFWPLFETHWKTTETMANRLAQPFDLCLLEIVSVARDADGKEYRVPLVEFDAAAPVTRSESFPGAKATGDVGTAAGTGSTVTPSRGTGL